MKKGNAETTPATRRKNLAEDVEAFLKAGNKIEHVPNGVSAQDPQGRGKPLRLGQGAVQGKDQDKDKDKDNTQGAGQVTAQGDEQATEKASEQGPTLVSGQKDEVVASSGQ